MSSGATVFLALGIGVVAGLRSLTAPAAVSWAAHVGWLDLEGSGLAFMGSTAAVVIFSLLAAAEFAADVLPQIPSRIMPGPLGARVISGAFSGACLCISSNNSPLIGVLLGGVGALVGAYAGYETRRRLVIALGVRDVMIAIPEDLVAVALAWFIVSQQ